nr:MAG TPA: hypothetical protein [Caudoviricetes sp.]
MKFSVLKRVRIPPTPPKWEAQDNEFLRFFFIY